MFARLLKVCFCLVYFTVPSKSAEIVRFPVNIHDKKDRYEYPLQLLKIALSKMGEYKIELVPSQGNQGRLVQELAKGRASFDVMFTGTNIERATRLRQVNIPLTRGLLGHRILITNRENIEKLNKIKSIQELRKIVIGSGIQWPDTEILKKGGLKVYTAKYETLFKLVQAKRIDGYARGAHEPYHELKSREDIYPDLVVDKRIAIVYPFDLFFFVAPHNEKLHRTIYQGLVKAYEDGSFMRHFNNHPIIKNALNDAQLESRRKFRISNPLLTQETRDIDKKYWMSN